jgi:hypothetical protein
VKKITFGKEARPKFKIEFNRFFPSTGEDEEQMAKFTEFIIT